MKLLTGLALLGLVVAIGYREVSKSCGANPAEGAHGHGETEETSSEGFGTRVCEAGFLAALGERLGVSTLSPVSARLKEAKEDAGHEHGAQEADGHTHGSEADGHDKEPDGHEHSAKEPEGHGHGKEGGHAHGAGKEEEGLIKLTAQQIAAAGIETAAAQAGTLVKEIAVPGRIALNADRQAEIVPKLSGTVATIDKRLGETVAKGDVLARIESREMADAKSQYLEAWRAEELAKAVFEREERLWKQKVTAEQDYLNAKNAFESAKIQLELAHQKLHTMGLEEKDIEAVRVKRTNEEQSFRTYEIRSPISGRVTARNLVLGEMVGTQTEIFNIADLSTVWVDLAVQPSDLPFAKEGQEVLIEGGGRNARGKIVALSPVIDPETRSARAIAEIDNADSAWQLGDYVRAHLISGRQGADVVVPRDALQTINGQKSVFVAQDGGFKAQSVITGSEDSNHVEIVSGLQAGESIATKNTFVLKAELGKSEAEHEH